MDPEKPALDDIIAFIGHANRPTTVEIAKCFGQSLVEMTICLDELAEQHQIWQLGGAWRTMQVPDFDAVSRFWRERGLNSRTATSLARAGITDLAMLTALTQVQLQGIEGIGSVGLLAISEMVQRHAKPREKANHKAVNGHALVAKPSGFEVLGEEAARTVVQAFSTKCPEVRLTLLQWQTLAMMVRVEVVRALAGGSVGAMDMVDPLQ